MIRFIVVVIVLVLFLVVTIPLFWVYYLIGLFNREKRDYLCLRTVQFSFKAMLFFAGTKVTVMGKENIPDEAVLFIANHRSFFDIHLTYSRCKRLTGYVAKKELLKAPILNWRMKDLYCLFLDRSNAREGMKTILTAIDYIKRGISVCIFPEGTRNEGEELSLMEFKEGSFKIATKTGCPIIPVSINNSAAIFENQSPKIRKAHVIIEYGTPIYPNELEPEVKKHIGAYCQGIMADTLAKNAKLI